MANNRTRQREREKECNLFETVAVRTAIITSKQKREVKKKVENKMIMILIWQKLIQKHSKRTINEKKTLIGDNDNDMMIPRDFMVTKKKTLQKSLAVEVWLASF